MRHARAGTPHRLPLPRAGRIALAGTARRKIRLASDASEHGFREDRRRAGQRPSTCELGQLGNNIADENIRWNVIEILDAYRAACGGGTTLESCENLLVSWAGDPTSGHFSLVAGAQVLAANGLKTAQARDAFINSGDDFGVSNLP